MIRRDAGHDFLLISQNDHAIIASQLAEHFGNARFAKVSPGVIKAVALHDAGWPLHDDEPTLDAGGYPLDVFQAPRAISLRVWTASADRAAAEDAYAGLLISLHSLWLSIHVSGPPISMAEKFDVQKMHEQFAVNKFQHREIERQERLRSQLGFDTKVPLKLGLAEAAASQLDDQLRFDFRLLQAMDLLSLSLCCTTPPKDQTQELLRDPSASPIKLRISKSLDGTVHVYPWPFDLKRIVLEIACRRVAGKKFDSLEEFRGAYHEARLETLKLCIAQ